VALRLNKWTVTDFSHKTTLKDFLCRKVTSGGYENTNT